VEEKTTNIIYKLNGIKEVKNLNILKQKDFVSPNQEFETKNYYEPIDEENENKGLELNDEKIESELFEINNNIESNKNDGKEKIIQKAFHFNPYYN